ncbi:MAG: hypothetical protein ACR2Q4_04255 [Geminicoccaceae bacterium]
MRLGIIVAMFAALLAMEANAGSVLVYDGRGDLNRVIRPSPSGFIVYDGQGNIVTAVRQFGFDRRRIVDYRSTDIRVLGTGLSEDVSGLQGGVGFE